MQRRCLSRGRTPVGDHVQVRVQARIRPPSMHYYMAFLARSGSRAGAVLSNQRCEAATASHQRLSASSKLGSAVIFRQCARRPHSPPPSRTSRRGWQPSTPRTTRARNASRSRGSTTHVRDARRQMSPHTRSSHPSSRACARWRPCASRSASPSLRRRRPCIPSLPRFGEGTGSGFGGPQPPHRRRPSAAGRRGHAHGQPRRAAPRRHQRPVGVAGAHGGGSCV
jgi:hypothetical protein